MANSSASPATARGSFAHEDDFVGLLLSHVPDSNTSQPRLPPGLGPGTHSSGLITQSGCVRRLAVPPPVRYLFERLARVGKNNGCARFRLIAPDDDVSVERIEFDAVAHPPGILGGDQGRSRAEEGVENNFATVCQVDQRVLQHCGWFHSRMIL